MPTNHQMKKLLWVANMVPHYNRELFVNLAARLPEHGIELHLVSGMTATGATGRSGLTNKVIPNEHKVLLREWNIGTYCIRLQHDVIAHVKSIRPDVVVSASQVGNLTTWRLMGLKRRLGFRLAAWQCGYEYHHGHLKSRLLAKYLRGFDYHLAYHTNAKQYALSHGAAADQIAVMHNTLNEAAIAITSRAEAEQQIAQRHPDIGRRKIILYVGAVLKEKRLDDIAQALSLIEPHNYVFLLVGDGHYLPELQARYASRQDIVFAGRVVDGVGAYFDAADVFVLPGTGGLALNEAMAHGLPIVSGYADGSADDLVITGHNGIRLQTSSVAELATSLQKILNNEAQRTLMGSRSRQLLLERFSFDAFLDRICRSVAQLAYGSSGVANTQSP